MSTEPLISRTEAWYQMRVPELPTTSEPAAGSSMWTHMSRDTSGKGAAGHSEVKSRNAAQERGWRPVASRAVWFGAQAAVRLSVLVALAI